MRTVADDVKQGTECRRRWHFGLQQTVWLSMEWPRRVERQGIHGTIQAVAERLSQFPIAWHSTPDGIGRDQLARGCLHKHIGKVARPQWLHGERLRGASVQWRAAVEQRTVHHANA